jgi:RND superfamily putative drug exporter
MLSEQRPSLIERWTLLVLRHPWHTLAVWLVALVVGVAAAVALPGRLANTYEIPGTGSARAGAALASGFGERPDGTFTVVFRVRHSSDRKLQRELRARLERAAHVLPGGRLATFRVGAGAIYGDVATTLGLQQAKLLTGRLRAALRRDGGPAALVTGPPAIQHDLDPVLSSDLRRGEAFAIPLAVLVLALLLGLSVALALPFVFAACTVSATFALLYVCARLVPVTPYAMNVVELIGLGLAIDYSLLVVTRYREELTRDESRQEAVVRTMATAGRAVVFSGCAAAVGLALLLFMPVPFIRTLGLAGLLLPLVSIVAALTLQPILLSFCGPRAVASRGLVRLQAPWAALARGVMRHRWPVLLATTAILVAAAVPLRSLVLTPGSLAGLPRGAEATRGLQELGRAFAPGAVTPTEIVVDGRKAGAARTPGVHAAVERLATRLSHDPEVYIVALGSSAPYVSADGRFARVFVVGRHEFGAVASRRLVARVRGTIVPAARFPEWATVDVGGGAPQGVDFLGRIYAFFPWLVLLSLALTFAVLVKAFRSLLLPLKAIALNVLTVAATYGLLTTIFAPTPIEAWVPVVLFATLFGLSMDYEVFLVSRMREAWDSGADNSTAVALGLERTGGLITASALVMAVTFGGLAVGSIPALRQLGTGLVIAVLIDATLIRALLVPAFMAILGRWNWWLPRMRYGRRVATMVSQPITPPITEVQ